MSILRSKIIALRKPATRLFSNHALADRLRSVEINMAAFQAFDSCRHSGLLWELRARDKERDARLRELQLKAATLERTIGELSKRLQEKQRG